MLATPVFGCACNSGTKKFYSGSKKQGTLRGATAAAWLRCSGSSSFNMVQAMDRRHVYACKTTPRRSASSGSTPHRSGSQHLHSVNTPNSKDYRGVRTNLTATHFAISNRILMISIERPVTPLRSGTAAVERKESVPQPSAGPSSFGIGYLCTRIRNATSSTR